MDRDDSTSSINTTHYDDRFTVHNYTTATSSASSAGSGSQKELLSAAQKLIKGCSTRYGKEEWVDVHVPDAFTWRPENLYEYSVPLPEIVVKERSKAEELKEWGAPVTQEEVWYIHELEEFESTDFSVIESAGKRVERPRRTQQQSGVAGAEKSTDVSLVGGGIEAESIQRASRSSHPENLERVDSYSRLGVATTKRPRPSEPEAGAEREGISAEEGPPPKRRRVDEGPLHGVIPRPHTFLVNMPSEASLPASLKEYKKTIPIILSPYTSPLPVPSKWETRAWIIPVRGTMPWEQATGAAVLDKRGGFEEDDESYRLDREKPDETGKEILKPVPPAPRSLEPVIWTREALRDFWEYLKVLRVGGKLGSLGMTFHAASRYKDGSLPSTYPQGQRFFNTQSDKSSARSTPSKVDDAKELGLSSVDYIKVYHDAVHSMFLRTAIDIWHYEVRDDKGQAEKIRVLKGAKLVLLDHLDRGMLIS